MTGTIFKNELKNGFNENKCNNRYSEEMKRFALTLHYNSPKAYKFLRYLKYMITDPSLCLYIPVIVMPVIFSSYYTHI